MNEAFQEALAVRLRWVDVVAFERTAGCEDLSLKALKDAFEAVQSLALSDVLRYRHYGAQPPMILQDVPELALQYTLAYEVYTDHYFQNAQGEWNSTNWACEALHNSPSLIPYCEWLAGVTINLSQLMQVPALEVAEATSGQTRTLFIAWSNGLPAAQAAAEVHQEHVLHLEETRLWEDQEAYRRHFEDIADTYAFIEADLWAGWREDCQELDMAA
ncbi:hypothetical protein IYR97_23695 (plasmid) [Pseudomonas fulva]|jgi:hypothetical protein|uniref:Transcriptional regulator n=3 Tax=Pseudomonas TaxID=286 RepID=A0A1X0ZMV0_PSEPU|nr:MULTISPECIES: hypothetical protein [Pseudomonas]MCT8164047.1 hypothetical protein [Pseudomonas sp. HD6422]MCT8182965.1 hypothetical protein [Pseudomonas sp. HD6421]MDM1711766.1 hypothetical protein [Pseudomonas sp. 165]ORL58800.1 hypothetical protein B7H17_25055 [Pseudomonas putida]ORL67193.1 hypothetical protein B7H19_19245 [Pseudomonas putida]